MRRLLKLKCHDLACHCLSPLARSKPVMADLQTKINTNELVEDYILKHITTNGKQKQTNLRHPAHNVHVVFVRGVNNWSMSSDDFSDNMCVSRGWIWHVMWCQCHSVRKTVSWLSICWRQTQTVDHLTDTLTIVNRNGRRTLTDLSLATTCQWHTQVNWLASQYYYTGTTQVIVIMILEYCSVVWHHGLTKTQMEQLEAVQRRAIRIIFEVTSHMPYQFAMACTNISSLHAHREYINKTFFRKIFNNPDNPRFNLLPPPRDTAIIGRLQSAHLLPSLRTRTSKYRSFIHYGLTHYQPKVK